MENSEVCEMKTSGNNSKNSGEMKAPEEMVMKNPKGSPKKSSFFKLGARNFHFLKDKGLWLGSALSSCIMYYFLH